MADGEPGEIPGLFVAAARLGGSIVQMAHAGSPGQIRAAEQLLEDARSRMYQLLADDSASDPATGPGSESGPGPASEQDEP